MYNRKNSVKSNPTFSFVIAFYNHKCIIVIDFCNDKCTIGKKKVNEALPLSKLFHYLLYKSLHVKIMNSLNKFTSKCEILRTPKKYKIWCKLFEKDN